MSISPLHLILSLLTLAAAATSQAHAKGWQHAQLLNLPEESFCKSSRIWASKYGGFHAVYLNCDPHRVQYRRYTNGRIGPVKILDSNFAANPEICEDGSGHVHVVWEDWESEGNFLGYAVSTDGGNTWSMERLTKLLGCKHPLIVPFGPIDGSRVLMSFTKIIQGEPNSIYYSMFNGRRWSNVVEIGSQPDNHYMIEGMCRSLQDGTVYRLYGKGLGDGKWALVFRRFNGEHWEPEVVVYTGPFFARHSIAVNPIGQIMVVWEVNEVVMSKLYTPGFGWSDIMSLEAKTGYAHVTAIPGSNDFYLTYTRNVRCVYGRRFSGGKWSPPELVSVGLPEAFTVGTRVTADPNGSGTLYACWEYWGSGRPQQYFSVKPGGKPIDATNIGAAQEQDSQR